MPLSTSQSPSLSHGGYSAILEVSSTFCTCPSSSFTGSTGRARRTTWSGQGAILQHLWGKKIQQAPKAPGATWLSPSLLQDRLPALCPFGTTRIPSLEQLQPARAAECLRHNQLCTAHCERRQNMDTDGGEKTWFIHADFGGFLTIRANPNLGQNSFKW